MSAPEPRRNHRLLGHQAAEAQVLEALTGGRLHHAWLITGPQGVGKATLAFRFARRVLAGLDAGSGLAMDPGHPVFRRVAAGTHADLLTVEREYDDKRKRFRAEIVVDSVRAAVGFMQLTPAEGGWRVVIIDGAENLNRNAANALLKVLEEPPGRALLMLVSSAPGSMLPTIRSRCRHLALRPLEAADMITLLGEYLPETPAADRARLAALAEGAPGRAVLLAEEEGLRLAGLVDGLLAQLDRLPLDAGHVAADAIGRGEDAFTTFMDLLRAGIARAVREAAASDAPQGFVTRRPLAAWVDVWHALGRLQAETENFHLDKRQAVISGLELLRAT